MEWNSEILFCWNPSSSTKKSLFMAAHPQAHVSLREPHHTLRSDMGRFPLIPVNRVSPTHPQVSFLVSIHYSCPTGHTTWMVKCGHSTWSPSMGWCCANRANQYSLGSSIRTYSFGIFQSAFQSWCPWTHSVWVQPLCPAHSSISVERSKEGEVP